MGRKGLVSFNFFVSLRRVCARGTMAMAHVEIPTSVLLKGVHEMVQAGIEQVPARYVRPAEETAPDVMNGGVGAVQVPVIDMAQSEDMVVAQVAEACKEWGFFQLINHPVPETLLSAMREVAEGFFALPSGYKMKFASHEMQFNPNSKALRFGTSFNPYSDLFLEWRDVLRHWCLPPGQPDNREWPDKPAAYKETVLEYNKVLRGFAEKVLEIIAKGLDLDAGYFEEAFQGSRQLLHVNRYPPCPQPELALGTGSHSDPGGLTLLLQDSVPGLQIMKDGQWVTVPPMPHAILINLGDQMQIMSNGRYKSVEHRAILNSEKTRMTVLSCYSPAEDVIVAPAAPLVARDNAALYQASHYGDYSLNFFSKGFMGKEYIDSLKLVATNSA